MHTSLVQFGTKIHDDTRYIVELLDGSQTSEAKPLDIGDPTWDMMMEYANFIITACNSHEALVRKNAALLDKAKAMLHIFDRDLPETSIGRKTCDEMRAAIRQGEG